MPTYYTTDIIDNNITFSEFAKKCLGAFIHPNNSEEPSDYYPERIEEIKKEIINYNNMSDDEVLSYRNETLIKEIERYKKKIMQDDIVLKKLYSMKKSVNEYVIPTEKHEKIKHFMLEQLDIEIESYPTKQFLEKVIEELTEALQKPITENRDEHLEEFEKRIKQYENSYKEEVENIKKSNDLVDIFLKSLPN